MTERGTTEAARFLSGSWLKVIALLSMTVDHAALLFLRADPILIFPAFGVDVTLYRVLRLVGRIAFPIYAFLVAEGYQHTRSRTRYGLSLLILAAVSQYPWSLIFGKLNVMFTLLYGYLGIWAYDALRPKPWARAAALFALLAVAVAYPADYGFGGYGFVLAMYLLRRHELARAVVGSCLLSNPSAALGFFPLHFYNGRRGFLGHGWGKYLFYLYYPLHLLAIYWLKRQIV